MKTILKTLASVPAFPLALSLAASAALLSGCALYVPDSPGVLVAPQGGPQGGPGNGFCPPGQAKKGNC
ncbi:putative lipoprotein [Paraburkholderia caffeinilytica]|uniref:Lipoprotein n=1 Tax=Paraburkholderia caffeinilytica TaxID=1761016 RepID=A0ABQ1LYU5_9BURK|nr:hypothetical protein [Paraburkholderia caffeinilytica]AXL53200.1 putative lipoprotein [Paraburkholderia caffeinilytica]GGC32136.1 hypothetical protein GCM10011400_18480 [Paraburkholderia caffeinilytica]CAB3796483.1 hypothetical protein LMG28690_04335 [Paraburkholderia caffeinilytica]